MNIQNRASEIKNSIKSAAKRTYRRNEVLPELLALQQEFVNLTFGRETSQNRNLRIWDVEEHLSKMNQDCGGMATIELQSFISGCKGLNNHISAECSGNHGESMAFRALDRMCTEHLILKNVELSDESSRTEIDAIVITHKGAFIIEVKNTRRNIFINENGVYYRTGEYLKKDSDLGGKMAVRRELLRNVLCKAGLAQTEIFEVVVFTNDNIEVHNLCSRIKTCFLGQLPSLIDRWNWADTLSTAEMHQAFEAIKVAKEEEAYPLRFDAEQLKSDFAMVLAKLEAAAQSDDTAREEVTETAKCSRFIKFLNTVFSTKHIKAVESAAAAIIAVAAFIVDLKNGL